MVSATPYFLYPSSDRKKDPQPSAWHTEGQIQTSDALTPPTQSNEHIHTCGGTHSQALTPWCAWVCTYGYTRPPSHPDPLLPPHP